MSIVLTEGQGLSEPIAFQKSKLVKDFLANQDVKLSSIDLYRKTIRRFFAWLELKRLCLSEVDRKTVLQYKSDLLQSSLSTLTVESYLTVVRKFFEWTETERIFPNVAKGIKAPRRTYKGFRKLPLNRDQIQELLLSIDRSTLLGKRDFALVNLLLRTGLRTIEIVRADIGDISQRYGQSILKVHGKGSDSKEDQYVVLTEKSLGPIRDYLKARGDNNPGSPLFASLSRMNRNERLTTRSIRKIVKEMFRSIGIDAPEYTAHSLRHTAGVLVLESGADLYSTQLFMRHGDPATTQIYLRTVEEKIRLNNHAGNKLDEII